MIFRRESLREIIAYVRDAGDRVTIRVEPARSFRVWVDLAERLDMRLSTPRASDDGLVELVFERLADRGRAVYGDKREDPSFVLDLADALERANLPPEPRVLSLGCNTGNELELVRAYVPLARFVGVDRDAAALAVARERFPDDEFLEADLEQPLAAGRFDLVLAIAVLQTGLDDRELLRRIVQDHLAPAGSVIVGVPNCRYLDGEVRYGARMVNFTQPELGLLVKDVAFYRKYLQQHGRQVYVTGKHYILVTGTPIGGR